MSNFRLRTKFLLSLLLIIFGLTGATLLTVHHTVARHFRAQIQVDLQNSVVDFRQFQRQREVDLAHSAELLADLPNLKAMMTTQDPATIQDASRTIWRLAGSSLFALVDRSGRVVALHTDAPGLERAVAQTFLQHALQEGDTSSWLYGGGHLYEVFLQPIYFGSPEDNAPLGVAALGFEIDDQVAEQSGRITASQVAFGYGRELVTATLPSVEQGDLARIFAARRLASSGVEQLTLGDERFLAASVELTQGSASPPVTLLVLKSYDQATRFMDTLDRLLLLLGLLAIAFGSLMVYLVSDTFTRPLGGLVAGVRALEQGDYSYPLDTRGRDEAAELARAFDRMRGNLQKTQQQLLETERLATIGRMASSISHDLRHPLTAVLANAEFLATEDLDPRQREELYQEIRTAVDHLTDLVDSLLDLSRAREHLRAVFGPMRDTIERAAHAVRMDPEFGGVNISVVCEGSGEGWFDQRRMERVFRNLLLNACQAAPRSGGKVEVIISDAEKGLEIRVTDNGRGIPESIRQTLFQPFVSFGKENGTGLGLTVAQKIFQDHGGDICVESTAAGRTVFKLVLPSKGLTEAGESAA